MVNLSDRDFRGGICMKSPFVIAISSVSGGGKTTITKQ